MTEWVSIIVQILVLAVCYHFIFLFLRGTRGAQVLVGLVLLLGVLIGLTQFFSLDALNWIFSRISVFLGIAVLIIFQPEIRRALAELGKQPVFTASIEEKNVIDQIVDAVQLLADQRVGALIAIEREIHTGSIQETGVRLDAPVVSELLASLFFPHTPLHDGGVIIKNNRMLAAACVFPLSQNVEMYRRFGTRHRAAVGMSEETDAIIIVVSEETGTVSVSYRGRLNQGLDRERLHRFLSALLRKGKSKESAWRRAQKRLDLTPEGIAQSDNISRQEATN